MSEPFKLLIATSFLLILISVACYSYYEDREFTAHSINTTGIIVEKYIVDGGGIGMTIRGDLNSYTNGNGRIFATSYRYCVMVRYYPVGAAQFDTSGLCLENKTEFDALKVGQTIAIAYRENAPNKIISQAEKQNIMHSGLSNKTMIWLAGALFFLVILFKPAINAKT